MVDKVAVLLSGGVDSSVTLYLAKEKYKDAKIEAFTLLLNKHNEEDIKRAKEVAKFLGVPHEVLDLREEFQKKVVEYFINEYREGQPLCGLQSGDKTRFGYGNFNLKRFQKNSYGTLR